MWEYMLVTLDENGYYTQVPDPDANSWHSISELGRDKWELVAVGWFRGSEATAIFKRPLNISQ